MSKLPRDLPPEDVIAALKRAGLYVRRTKGSHVIMQRDEPFAWTIIPIHDKIPVGLLRQILNDVQISTEEFIRLLK
ncbi:MAG: type II toxin-antitoxin system HicA family toxin [Firmicutes bacterium]|nr:type II toxin-antitoxin system HicA family toxin [Bacillota bacterium]